jgi:hypothetical protein
VPDKRFGWIEQASRASNTNAREVNDQPVPETASVGSQRCRGCAKFRDVKDVKTAIRSWHQVHDGWNLMHEWDGDMDMLQVGFQ